MPQYLVHSRASDAADTIDVDDDLNERHWDYMDGFADAITQRGPTLEADRETWTGSVHVVGLAGPDDAGAFLDAEPYQRAGLFGSHTVWELTDLIEPRSSDRADPEPRFLVLASGCHEISPAPPELDADLRGRVVFLARLRDLADGREGIGLAVHAPSREAAWRLLEDGVLGTRGCDTVEVHDWEIGGRR